MAERDAPGPGIRRFLWPVEAPQVEQAAPEPPPALERRRALPFALGVTVAVFLGINLLLTAAYLWSRGGQTTHVSIVVRDAAVTAYIDGHQTGSARLAGPDHGGIVLTIAAAPQAPDLPTPRGIDSVRVTDLDTGSVLFEDDFSSNPARLWEQVSANVSLNDGVLGSRGEATLSLAGRPWRNYAVDAIYRNLGDASIMVRATSVDTGVVYRFGAFRDYRTGFALLEKGETKQQVVGPLVELRRTETVKSLVAMALDPFPRLFVLLAAGLAIVLVMQWLPVPRLSFAGRLAVPAQLGAATAFVAFAFAATLFFILSYGQRMPHVPDELAYIFQAKLLTSAHLTAPLPPVQGAFDYFYPPFIIASGTKWLGIYPFGHPLVLSLGLKMHALWLMPPLTGAASALLLFLIGRKVYNGRVAVLATLLFVTSPFYLMTASNFMSNNTAAFYLLCCIACIAYAENEPYILGALGGLSFGLFFNTQALSAVVLIGPLGLLLLSELLPFERRLTIAKFLAAFAATAFLMLGAYFLYNRATTGDAFTSGLQLSPVPGQYVLFGGANSPSIGIQNQQALLASLILVLNGWPLTIGLMFALVPFVLATRHRWDWFLLVASVCAMGVYVLYIYHGIMYGPRFWYVLAPLLLLLTARGAERAGEALGATAAWARRRITGADVSAHWAGVAVAYLFVAALVGSGIYGWLLGRHTTWVDAYVPASAVELRGFNGVDDRLTRLVDQARLRNALVLVQNDCLGGWQCYGSVFWRNAPALDGDIVYARDIPERRPELLRAYPNRFVYLATYVPSAKLVSYPSLGPVVANALGPLNAQRARQITPPAPPPTPTPKGADMVQRDGQRKRDLAAIAGALQTYYTRHGAYPLARGLQTFCAYKDLDAGCLLREVLDPLPADPSGGAYWYQSDGQSFVVEAVSEQPAGTAACIDIPSIDPKYVYCVNGAAPVTPTPVATP